MNEHEWVITVIFEDTDKMYRSTDRNLEHLLQCSTRSIPGKETRHLRCDDVKFKNQRWEFESIHRGKYLCVCVCDEPCEKDWNNHTHPKILSVKRRDPNSTSFICPNPKASELQHRPWCFETCCNRNRFHHFRSTGIHDLPVSDVDGFIFNSKSASTSSVSHSNSVDKVYFPIALKSSRSSRNQDLSCEPQWAWSWSPWHVLSEYNTLVREGHRAEIDFHPPLIQQIVLNQFVDLAHVHHLTTMSNLVSREHKIVLETEDPTCWCWHRSPQLVPEQEDRQVHDRNTLARHWQLCQGILITPSEAFFSSSQASVETSSSINLFCSVLIGWRSEWWESRLRTKRCCSWTICNGCIHAAWKFKLLMERVGTQEEQDWVGRILL